MEAHDRATFRDAARLVMTLAVVLGTTAALLRGLDAVPGLIIGEPRGVRPYPSIEEAERRLRVRLVVPAYFPDTLRWPPTSIRVDSGPPASVALGFKRRDANDERLIVVQAFGGATTDRLLPSGVTLHTATVSLHGRAATLTRVLTADGRIWHDVRWRVEDRAFTVRSSGAVDELVRIAASTGARP